MESRGIFRALSNIYDEVFLQKIVYFCQLLTVRCLARYLNAPLQSFASNDLITCQFQNYYSLKKTLEKKSEREIQEKEYNKNALTK